jgi:1,2-phenylacetyl-CoA epoxidase catalytic subunit
MFDIKVTVNQESNTMAALDLILSKITEIQAGVEAEKAEVKAALDIINKSVDELKAQLASAVENQVDVAVVESALDSVKAAVDSIYTVETPV